MLKGQLLPSAVAERELHHTDAAAGIVGHPAGRNSECVRATHDPALPSRQRLGSDPAGDRDLIAGKAEYDAQRELARANVSSQWGLVIAAKGNIAAGKSAVEASRIALQGTREEEKVGQRTILDVLSAEQTYLNAGVNLVSFQRDLMVASYGVLAYEGRLTAYDIALEAELYDPARYYGEVKDAWWGWGASLESLEDPRVAPVDQSGRTPWQTSTDGPAYTQKLPQIP